MKFFQVLITNKFKSTFDRQYTSVYNYASLAEALRNIHIWEDKDAVDGFVYIKKGTGMRKTQYHLTYEEDGAAVIELRHEYFGIPEGCSSEQVVCQKSVYVKEINL